MEYTKIVATIGPLTSSPDKLKSLFKAGMDIARLNGSHNSFDWHKKTISTIRKQLPMVPILMDIPGKKIRTENLEFEPSFKVNDTIILTCEQHYKGRKKIPLTNKKLYLYVKKGERIIADDGTLSFTVDRVVKIDIYCLCLNKGKLRSKKGINVPNIAFKQELLTKKDKNFLHLYYLNKFNHNDKKLEFLNFHNYMNIVHRMTIRVSFNFCPIIFIKRVDYFVALIFTSIR